MKPQQSWGKANRSFLRYEEGRLEEQDERIQGETPHVFSGRDETRATEPSKAKRKRNKLPRPGKNEPLISGELAEKYAYPLMPLQEFAQWKSEKKQAFLACRHRGHHDWRAFIGYSGKRAHVCVDCATVEY